MTNQVSAATSLAYGYSAGVPIEKTDFVGNVTMGQWHTHDYQSKGRSIKRIDVCFTAQVIKGIGMTFWGDDAQYAAGDWNNPKLSNTFTTLHEDDLLAKFGISTDPSMAQGSVRGLYLQTKKGKEFTAGYVTSPYSWLDVDQCALMGFYAWENVDRFIAALGLWITVRPKSV